MSQCRLCMRGAVDELLVIPDRPVGKFMPRSRQEALDARRYRLTLGHCAACGMVGYDGRSGVFEVMTVDKAIRNMISEGRPTREIRDAAVANGMLQLRHSALLKVAQGVTSTEEVFRVIPSEYLLHDD